MKMPVQYFVEMVMDRIAASRTYRGRAYTDGDPYAYFSRSKDVLTMHPETKRELDKVLRMLEKKGEAGVYLPVSAVSFEKRGLLRDLGGLEKLRPDFFNILVEPDGILETGGRKLKESSPVFGRGLKFRNPDRLRLGKENAAFFFRIARFLCGFYAGVPVHVFADAFVDRRILVDQIIVVLIAGIIVFKGSLIKPDGKLQAFPAAAKP